MIQFSHLQNLSGITHGITEKGESAPDGLVVGGQVHKDVLAWVDGSQDQIPGTDALATRTPGVGVGVVTADCVPILFADEKAGIVGVIHAGWRGTALEIARKTIEGLKIHPSNLKVGIGPAICPDCFEVGSEVARQFSENVVRPSEQDDEKYFLDLWQANIDQLVEAGVKQSSIEVIRRCTFEDPVLYSFRGGDRDDRLVAWIRQDG